MKNDLKNRSTDARTCPFCMQKTLLPKVVDYSKTVTLDRTEYLVRVPELRAFECVECSEQFFGNTANHQIDDALRAAAGLLRSSDILRCRKALGLTQKALAELIGASSEAVCRWERGLIVQGRMANRAMMLVFRSAEARKLMIALNQNPVSTCEVAKPQPFAGLLNAPRFIESSTRGWSAEFRGESPFIDESTKHAA